MVVYVITDAQRIAVHALCATLETCVKYVSIQSQKNNSVIFIPPSVRSRKYTRTTRIIVQFVKRLLKKKKVFI